MVVCGSAASWMIQNVVRSCGGLHNRLTRQIRILPFTLNETEHFLQLKNINLTRPFRLLMFSPGLVRNS
jgi:uncharacterized protein